jgi:hypothetical protein
MFRSSRLLLMLFCAWISLSGDMLFAAVVKLRIRAGNPSSNQADRVEIKANLPERVGTNEIISLGGMDLGYDIKADGYYVFKEVELGPKETRDFTVELKDIWVIPEDELELLGGRARDLAELLKGRAEFEEAEGLQKEAADALVRIKEVQDSNRIGPGLQVSQHITAYESNILALERVQEAVGSLENLVLGSGQDPGELIGSVKDVPEPDRDVQLAADQYKTALYRIKVTNPSEKESKKIPLVRELPAEITLDDVLDAGGLDLKSDPRTGVTYVYTNGLELAAGESRTFVVKIRDKWNVNFVRIDRLRQLGSNILSRISVQERVESIENAVSAINGKLDLIEAEATPQALNSDYVAFFRDQGDRIDLLEAQLNRISSALKPINKNQKMGFDAKPPSSKTTWMIIYIILGFLLFMSVVFFFRWWGGSDAVKEEKSE